MVWFRLAPVIPAIVFGLVSLPAKAQVSCVAPAASAPPANLQQASPQPTSSGDDLRALLAANPAGGGGLSIGLRNRAAQDMAAVRAILSLVPEASPEQRAAIGVGLGSAAMLCLREHADMARLIQAAVVALDDEVVTRSFAGVTGDIFTGAVGTSFQPAIDTADATPGGGPNPPRPAPSAAGPLTASQLAGAGALIASGGRGGNPSLLFRTLGTGSVSPVRP